MKNFIYKNSWNLLLSIILIFSVSSYAAPPDPLQYREARFEDLQSLDTLKNLFERDNGKIRLLLLMSPTCSVCVRGARWVQENILTKYPTADFQIYTVWMPTIRGDSKLAVPGAVALLPDSRVLHFWDPARLSGVFFKKNVAPDISSSVAWDMFFLYDENAKWDEIPSPLIDMGRTVIATSGSLGFEFGELMKRKSKSAK